MPTKPDKAYPEIWVVPASNEALAQEASRAVARGQARRIVPGLYTGNLTESLAEVVRRNIYEVLGTLYPGCVLSHRTAFKGGGVENGHIFATYKYGRNIVLTTGITVHLLKGPLAQTEDVPFPHEVWMSSEARMFLENMQVSRARKGMPAKTVTQEDIEARLIRTMDTRGEAWLNELRDAAAGIAARLGWDAENQRLYKLIGAMLGTQKAKLVTLAARARGSKPPYDADRVEAFDRLATYLRANAWPRHPDTLSSPSAVINGAFFEAYFSNFIEGTEFEVAEAKAFVLDGIQPKSRPVDAHDIIGTYQIIIDRKMRDRLSTDVDDFMSLLKQRHEILMKQRPENKPGAFKEEANVAGNTRFVMPDQVRGTLAQGFQRLASLADPFARAAYMMFLVTEVHPFVDGNGRLARLFMNAELSAAGLARIIVPIVYRDDYLSGMRAITRNRDDAAYLRMVVRTQDFSRRLSFDDYDASLRQLEAANAFEKPDAAKLVLPPEPAATAMAVPDQMKP